MRTISLVAGVGAMLVFAAAAHAEPPLRDVGPALGQLGSGTSQVIADGAHVAYMSAPGRVRVIDERLAEVATVAAPGCTWRSFGGGALLWRCGTSPEHPFGYSLIDEVADDRRTVLGSPLALGSGGHGEEPDWSGVGRRWLSVSWGEDYRVYVHRSTGKVVRPTVEYARARDHVRAVTDLDQEDLTRPVCAPLVPKFVPGLRGASVVAPLAYRSPLGATRSGSRLLMGRCGARRLTVLSRCPRSCSEPVVGDGFVAWSEAAASTRRSVYVRLADRGRTWRWQVPAPSWELSVAAVGRRLFVATPGLLKTVRLPGARARR